MTVRIDVSKLSAGRIAFRYSPIQEAINSLHVLAESGHHPLHIPWVLRARKALSPALKGEVEAFALLYGRPVAVLWEPGEGDAPRTFEAELQELARAPLEQFGETVIRLGLGRAVSLPDLLADGELQDGLLTRVARKAPQSSQMVAAFLQDPEASRQRFLAFLAAYWERCLAAEWPQIEAVFERDIARRKRLLASRGGALAMLDDLAPEIGVDYQRKVLTVRRPTEADITIGEGDPLYLAPTWFLWPHLFLRFTPPVAINYPVLEMQEKGRPPVPPDRLLQLLQACADPTRLGAWGAR